MVSQSCVICVFTFTYSTCFLNLKARTFFFPKSESLANVSQILPSSPSPSTHFSVAALIHRHKTIKTYSPWLLISSVYSFSTYLNVKCPFLYVVCFRWFFLWICLQVTSFLHSSVNGLLNSAHGSCCVFQFERLCFSFLNSFSPPFLAA